MNRDKCEQDIAQREKCGESELREIENYQRNLDNIKIRMQQLLVSQDQVRFVAVFFFILLYYSFMI